MQFFEKQTLFYTNLNMVANNQICMSKMYMKFVMDFVILIWYKVTAIANRSYFHFVIFVPSVKLL